MSKRDRLFPVYFNVNLNAVWSMVEQDLPKLRWDIERILLSGDDIEEMG